MSTVVLVLAEHLKGEITGVTFQVLGAGRMLAEALGTKLHVALCGEGVSNLIPQLGAADKVWAVTGADVTAAGAGGAAAILHDLLQRTQGSLVLLGGTNTSMGAGSALAARANLPCVNFCRGLRVDAGSVIVTSQLFGGKILADVLLTDARGVITISPSAFAPEAGHGTGSPEVEEVPGAAEKGGVVFRRLIEPESADVDITKQDILVGVGRGVQTQENLAVADELAAELGGAVCASRPVIDQGWLPLSRQVGKSGYTVKPRLYLALGISGAPEHVEGMAGSQLTIAVNTDPRAPIFECAHYGACADLLELAPALTERIKARRAAVAS